MYWHQIFGRVFLHGDLNTNQLQNDHLNKDLLHLDGLYQNEHLILFRNDKLVARIFWQFLILHVDHHLVWHRNNLHRAILDLL